MADNSSTVPGALQDFLRYCGQPTFQVDSTKHTIQKIVKQALSDMLEPIKPGRFLSENQSIRKKNKVETVEQDKEEQTPEVEEEGEEEEDGSEYETEHALSLPTEDRNVWLARVRKLTDGELCTPKVRANLQLLQHIHEGFYEDLARQNTVAHLPQLQLRFRRRRIWVSVIVVVS